MVPNLKVIQFTTGATTSITAANVAATWGSNTSNGNLIVVGVNGGTSTTSGVSDTQGNTYVQAESGNNTWADCEIWYAKNISGGAGTVTAAFVGTMPATIHIYEVSGADISFPLDQHTNNAGNGVTSNTPTVTTSATTNTNELVFVVSNVYLGAGTDTYTVGTGYSNFSTTNSTPTVGITTTSGAETNTVGLIGTQTATFNLGFASTTWEISIATFKAFTQGTTTSTSSTSISSTSASTSSTSVSSTSASTSSTSYSTSLSSTSASTSSTSSSISSTSSSTSSTSISSTSSSTSLSSTSSSISSTSQSSTSQSSTSSSISISSTSSSISSTSSSTSSTSVSISSTSASSTSSSSSTSTTTLPPPYYTDTYIEVAH